MKPLKIHLLFISLLCFSSVFGQQLIKGRVLDAQSETPLEFCHVINKTMNIGGTTNTQGEFAIWAHPGDTLVVSYVGFIKQQITVQNQASWDIYLTPSEQKLGEFVLVDNTDYIWKLFLKESRKLNHKKLQNARGYFNLQTSSNQKPLEQMESYYNVTRRPDSISRLALKTGRVGLAKNGSKFFLSLNSTRVMGQYNLFSGVYNKLPANPMQFNLKYLKKNYQLEGVVQYADALHFSFVAKAGKPFFNAEVWINTTTNQIQKYVLSADSLTKHPFLPLFSGQSIDSLGMEMIYEFSEHSQQQLIRQALNYKVKYSNQGIASRYSTQCFLLLYNYDELFSMPEQPEFLMELSDYDKIVAQPYNPIFWEHMEGFTPSEEMERNRQFFEKNGVLINYNDLQLPQNVFVRHTQPWNTKRIRTSDLNNGQRFNYSSDRVA
jgi:hypothetical protein